MPTSGRSTAPSSTWSRKTFRLTGEISNDLILDLELMALALATGIMDATTFSDYHVFVSNQTGNTALLAVGALGIGGSDVKLPNVGVSLGVFIAGGFVLGQIGNALGPRRRLWLIATNLFQTVLVGVATALRWRYATADGTPGALGVLALLAFASGGQIAVARKVNVPEITTAMVTSAYIDLIIDSRLIDQHNRPRNRRFFFICMLLLGSFIGAIADSFYGPELALLLSAVCKLGITMAFLTNAEASYIGKPARENKCEGLSILAENCLPGPVDTERLSMKLRSVNSAPP